MKQVIFILAIMVSWLNLSAQNYDFPIKPGTDQWKRLNSHDEMIKVCQIPDSLIGRLSTIDLINTSLNYPLLFDLYAYENPKKGFDIMSKNFNGFRYLKTRTDAIKVMAGIYTKLDVTSVEKMSDLIEKGRFTMFVSVIEIFLSDSSLISTLEYNERISLLKDVASKNKRKNKEIFGTLGRLTAGFLAATILNSIDDAIWNDLILRNEKLQKFTHTMLLTDESTLNKVFENTERVLNK